VKLRGARPWVAAGLCFTFSGSALAAALATSATPAGLTHYVAPQFPPGLRGVKQGDGHVVLAMTVGATGAVLDCVALEASHDAFAVAAVRAARDWSFAPANAATQPRREVMQFEFRRTGAVSSLAHAEAAAESLVVTREDGALRTVQWEALPAPPRRATGGPPRLPPEATAQLRQSPVVASFVIDSEGRVRLATVGAEVPAELAAPLLDAMASWRYAPLLLDGRAVQVQATTRFGAAP
jgi:TonB family protein